jgi:hypothetical protein
LKPYHKNGVRSAEPGTIKCLRNTENALLKMEKLLLIWISEQHINGGNANSTLIRQKTKSIFWQSQGGRRKLPH